DVHRPGVRRRRAVEWRPHRHARAGWWSERAVALEPLHRHRGSELRPRRGDTLTERLEIELGREIEGENPKHGPASARSLRVVSGGAGHERFALRREREPQLRTRARWPAGERRELAEERRVDRACVRRASVIERHTDE